MNEILLSKIRKSIPNIIAEEICSVQPISIDFNKLLNESKSEKDLVDEGYTPISADTRLLWWKDE